MFRCAKLKKWRDITSNADKHVMKREEGEVRAGKGAVTVRKDLDLSNN